MQRNSPSGNSTPISGSEHRDTAVLEEMKRSGSPVLPENAVQRKFDARCNGEMDVSDSAQCESTMHTEEPSEVSE